jgi:hypothetical protein
MSLRAGARPLFSLASRWQCGHSRPGVMARPSLRIATAFTALSCKRSTDSAAFASKRPADRRCVEVARERRGAIGRDRQRAYRTATPAQLRFGSSKGSTKPISLAQTDQTRSRTHERRFLRPRAIGCVGCRRKKLIRSWRPHRLGQWRVRLISQVPISYFRQ